ncbi:trypsin-like peptidase domain-containing protein [bacterium]|nr:MAG: trypsin-like peptidase domain-containing protein [bacterium]
MDRKFQIQQDKIALRSFVDNFHWSSGLSDEEAKLNLHDGLREIVYGNGYHAGNALLVTKNGYIITCYHCIFDYQTRPVFIRSLDGKGYRIEKICGYSTSNDIALAKIALEGPAEPIRYRFAVKHDIEQRFVVDLLVRIENRLKKKTGVIHFPMLSTYKNRGQAIRNEDLRNQVAIHMNGQPGDSGGIITTERSEIYGVLASRSYRFRVNPLTGVKYDEQVVATCTFWFEALGIIQKVIGYR